MTINIYIGDTSESLAAAAKAADPMAFLIDHSNLKEFLDSPKDDSTVYTSLGDLPKIPTGTKKVSDYDNAVYSLLDLADNIYYCPPDAWSDNKTINLTSVTDSLQGLTEYILYEFKQQKNNVYNLNLTDYSSQAYTELVDSRKIPNQQLWISGCSISHGVGVDPTQRYGQLVADELNLPVSFLTAGSSSISWAIDQIVRSNICSGDIVILGLTNEVRFPYWTTDNNLWHINVNHRDQAQRLSSTNLTSDIIDRLITDDNCFYQSIIRIHQLVNFCNKINAKLLIFGLICSPSLALHLNHINNFVNYKNFKSPNCKVDLGVDGQHPGPKQHKLYADFCQATLKKLNYI
jgi:hypothetical protein